MTIRDDVSNKLKEAMIRKDVDLINAYRLIIAAIKDKDIIAKGKGNSLGIKDQEINLLLNSMIKQRKVSAEMYIKGNREDLAKKEKIEIEIISNFLPEQLSDEEIKNIINYTIKETDAKSIKDMGKVMNIIKEKYVGKIDFGVVSKAIKEKLTNL